MFPGITHGAWVWTVSSQPALPAPSPGQQPTLLPLRAKDQRRQNLRRETCVSHPTFTHCPESECWMRQQGQRQPETKRHIGRETHRETKESQRPSQPDPEKERAKAGRETETGWEAVRVKKTQRQHGRGQKHCPEKQKEGLRWAREVSGCRVPERPQFPEPWPAQLGSTCMWGSRSPVGATDQPPGLSSNSSVAEGVTALS